MEEMTREEAIALMKTSISVYSWNDKRRQILETFNEQPAKGHWFNSDIDGSGLIIQILRPARWAKYHSDVN